MRVGVFIGSATAARTPVAELLTNAREAEARGFATAWVPHMPWSLDALSALALASTVTERIELGTAVVPTFPRHPIAMAQEALTVQAASGGRLLLGIGPSHRPVIERMLGIPYEKPAANTEEYVEVLQRAFAAGSATEQTADYEGAHFHVHAMLEVPGSTPPSLMVAALGPRMLDLAGRLADGTITYWADERAIGEHVAPLITQAATAAGRRAPRVVAGMPVAVVDHVDAARAEVHQMFADYRQLEIYRRILDHGSTGQPGDVAIVGTEREVRGPGQVVLAITPYGLSGPWAEAPWSDLVIQAESGGLATRGLAHEPPFMAGGRTNEWIAGAYGAAAALAGWRWVRGRDRGELVDVSMLEAAHIAGASYSPLLHDMNGRPPITAPARTVETVEVHPSRDGWIGFTTNSGQQFQDFLVMIDRADLVGDEQFHSAAARQARGREWTDIVEGWTTAHDTAEIVELAGLFRVPCAPVQDAQQVFEFEHFVERRIFRTAPDGSFRYPRPPWLMDAVAPVEGAIDGPGAPSPGHKDRLPLDGITVVDLTAWWAGPTATHLLACLGADVIHVESITRPDGMRMQGGTLAALGTWWERSSFFLSSNTNKRGLTLDLTQPRGLEVLLDLLRTADILVENFTPRVLDNLGLTRERLAECNPALITVRMPAFGLDGPWRDRPGFAQTMEQLSGLAWLTGFADGQPHNQRGPSDPNGGIHAAFAAMCALEARAHDGRGRTIEAPFIEVALNVATEQLVEFSSSGAILQRDGNRAPTGAPQGLYPCAGTEQWLALSVETDAQWRALVRILGDPAWASDPALVTFAGRRAAHDEIDAHLTQWAAQQELDTVVVALRDAGVAAGRAVDPRLSDQHEQFTDRRFFETLDHPVVGTQSFVTLPFRFASVDRWLHAPAPTLGQHNGEILRALGYDDATIGELEEHGIIGTVPVGLG